MQRKFVYPPYDPIYGLKYKPSNEIKPGENPNAYVGKYGLQKIYWYRYYIPPSYEDMYKAQFYNSSPRVYLTEPEILPPR